MNESVDKILEECITKGSRKSFFLFAGAGSGIIMEQETERMCRNKCRKRWRGINEI